MLRVDAIHENEPLSRTTTAAVRAELDALAGWLGLTRGQGRPQASPTAAKCHPFG